MVKVWVRYSTLYRCIGALIPKARYLHCLSVLFTIYGFCAEIPSEKGKNNICFLILGGGGGGEGAERWKLNEESMPNQKWMK